MRYALLLVLLAGCPETDGADCDEHPERRVCVDVCITAIDQLGCQPVVDVCRAEPERDRCNLLLATCDEMPTALGCGGSGDAGTD